MVRQPKSRTLNEDSLEDRYEYNENDESFNLEIGSPSKRDRRKKRKKKINKMTKIILSFITLIPIVASIYTQRTLTFTNLIRPLNITDSVKPVSAIGLFEVVLCPATPNENVEDSKVMQSNQTETHDFFDRAKKDLLRPVMKPITFEFQDAGCGVMNLRHEDTNDLMWVLSRSFSSAAIYCGIMSSLALWISFYREGEKLGLVSFLYFAAYFCQMAVFTIFDSRICTQYGCQLIERGTISCFLALVLWLAFGIGVTRIKIKRKKKRKRASRKLEDDFHRSDLTLPTFDSTPIEV